MSQILVTKRNGSKEPLDLNKFHKVVSWACDGINGVSESEIEIRSHIQFYNGIKTSDVQETLIKAAADLISEDNPGYQYVAGRLINYHLRKEVYGSFSVPTLADHIRNVISAGYYDPDIEKWYSPADLDTLNGYLDHKRDFSIAYVGMEQFRGKYLIKNRVTGKIFETPQMAYMLIAMVLFRNYKEDRLKWIKELYDATSTFEISLPTPIMAGLRSPQKQFSSCVLIETTDSLDSINATASSIVKYVSQKAGIGIGAGRIRALGSPIRNGDATHTGVIPFYKHFQSAVKSCSQGGVRGGAATLYYPIWHLEVEDLLVLKNNKGTEDNRIRGLDYGVQFNKVMYERLLTGGNITLFSPNDVPDLYDAFFIDVDKFRELYEKYERAPRVRKKSIPAIDLFSAFMQERKDTGRIYLQNVDHANDHGSFIKELAPIRQSNLCSEIDLPTKPLNDINDPEGEISLCTLAAINWGKIRDPSDFDRPCTLAVRAIDELLDYCSRSANPVGRIMLALSEYHSPELLNQSDAICTALQLINFLQDVAIDWEKSRIYLPQQDLSRFGVSEQQIAEGLRDHRWRALMQFQVERARSLMLQGAPLPLNVGGRLGWELRFIVHGGLRILEKIEAVDYDVFRQRPILQPLDWLLLGWRALSYSQSLSGMASKRPKTE